MIISHLWLDERRSNADPEEQFAILATNLEKVPLRYRFLFVVSQEASNVDCTEILLARIGILLELGNLAPDLSVTSWLRQGRLYRRNFEVVMPPGETLRVGLHTGVWATPAAASVRRQVFQPDNFLRGHWELSLPALSKGSGGPPQKQFHRPARVLVTVLRRRRSAANVSAPHETWVLPLALGQAEHLIPPDIGPMIAEIEVTAATVATQGVASSRKVVRRRRR